jgi:hypothetical protein
MSITSQEFESYVPLYDVVPEKWEEARADLIEYLKKISNAVNVREIGWFLDEELLSGGQFIPGTSSNNLRFRSILRKVINCSPLTAGANTFAHGITVDANFTLVHMYGAATNRSTLVAEPLPNGIDTLSMNATNVIVTVAANWPAAFVTIEYIQEL